MFELVDRIRVYNKARRAARQEPATGPLFAFLVGAGFSLSAGMPGTPQFVHALRRFQANWCKEGADEFCWEDALTDALDLGVSRQPLEDGDYYDLMEKLMGSTSARQAFITSAVQWAAMQRLQTNQEAVLLASLLEAGCGHSVPLKKEIEGNPAEEAIVRACARHVFTTNFDEVIPTTFYLWSKPLEIVDRPLAGAVAEAPTYPTVVYLHGRHLHYGLRNTPAEIGAAPQSAAAAQGDLLHQFRQVLKRCGLIVLGYSGINDGAMREIRSALEDADSLPMGLWWVAYRGAASLKDEVKTLLSANPAKARLIAPEADQSLSAAQFLVQLCDALGVDRYAVMDTWIRQVQRAAEHAQGLAESEFTRLNQYISQAQRAYYSNSPAVRQDALGAWTSQAGGIVEKLKADNPGICGDACQAAAKLLQIEDRYPEAVTCYQQALALHREAGDKLGEANDLRCLGDVSWMQGASTEAADYYQQALALHREAGDKLGEANDLRGLGDVASLRDAYPEAADCYQQALALFREAGSNLGAANALQSLGGVTGKRNACAEAADYYRQALALHREAGVELGEANDLQGLGDMALQTGDHGSAEQHYAKAGEIQAVLFGESGLAAVLNDFGLNLLLLGQYDRAAVKLQSSLALQGGHWAYFNLAHAKWLRADADAVDYYREGIAEFGGLTEVEVHDFVEFIRRGLTTAEKVNELKQALGLPLDEASPLV